MATSRISTKKILVASLGVAVATFVSAAGCNRYPVGNLMPPKNQDSMPDADAPDDAATALTATPDASTANVNVNAADASRVVAPDDLDPRVTSGNLMAPRPRPDTTTPVKKKDAGR